MAGISLSEWNEFVLKMKYDYLKALCKELESRIVDAERRLSELEYEKEELRRILGFKQPPEEEELWLRVRGHAIESKSLNLLNPSKRYGFQVVEVSKDFIRVDKLGKTRLVKEMFISVYDFLKEVGEWVRIGASVVDTKPETVEGFLKNKFFDGDMNGHMTAPWVAALLVGADVGIEFNNKAVGQAIRYADPR